jgi:putative transcriptional regulator
LANIDVLTSQDAIALQLVAHFFNATPLVVGQKTRKGRLDPGVVYKRYGVSTIAPPSFQSMIAEETMPREFSQKGGRFVAIDGEKLRKVLETDLIIPIDILRERVDEKTLKQPGVSQDIPDLEARVNHFFERLGMRVLWTDRAPFHVAAKEEGPPLMSGIGSITSWSLKKRMEILKSVSKVTESDAVIIVEEGQAEESVSDLPVIKQLELDQIEKSRELKKIIEERSNQ